MPRPSHRIPTPPGSMPAWLLVALALPRIVRLLYPAIWIEDDLLMESAFAVARGLRPYLDFAHAQMPLLEWCAGLYITVAGASHVSMELLNGAAIYATSVLVFVLGREAVGRQAAIAAALLFACSSLVFRYHVWAREFFVSALVLAAAVTALNGAMRASRQVPAMAALLTAACGIKLTAIVSAAGVIGFIAVRQRRPARALALALAIGGGVLALGAFCYWRYGVEFLFQAFLFHFLKGRDAVGAGPMYSLSILDVLVPLSALGLVSMSP